MWGLCCFWGVNFLLGLKPENNGAYIGQNSKAMYVPNIGPKGGNTSLMCGVGDVVVLVPYHF